MQQRTRQHVVPYLHSFKSLVICRLGHYSSVSLITGVLGRGLGVGLANA